jgi:hypothetical protein
MLLVVTARLCEELGSTSSREAAGDPNLPVPPGRPLAISHELDPKDERFVAGLRGALGKIVMTLDPDPEEAAMDGALAALDAAESMIGVELLQSRPERLPKLMPSFVFLLARQVVGQDRALELSERAAELIAEEQRADPNL